MAVIVTPKEEIDNYFSSSALSQSKLKTLDKGLAAFVKDQSETELYYQENESFVLGSAVDCILTGERGQFDKEYHISTIDKKPSEVLMSICNSLIDIALDDYNNIQQDLNWIPKPFKEFVEDDWDILFNQARVENVCNDHAYGKSYKAPTKLAKVLEHSDYIKDQIKGEGKQVLSKQEKDIVDTIVYNLTTNPVTSNLFDRNSYTEGLIDVYYQLPIYFNWENIECKALLDLVIVFKSEEGEVLEVHPYDLKTMSGPTHKFLFNVKKFRYDVQAAFYTKALIEKFQVAIDPYSFIVESTTSPGTPLIYVMEESLLDIGLRGRPGLVVGGESQDSEQSWKVVKDIKGIYHWLEDYKWYSENGTKEERVVKENNGVLKINWDEIVTD